MINIDEIEIYQYDKMRCYKIIIMSHYCMVKNDGYSHRMSQEHCEQWK